PGASHVFELDWEVGSPATLDDLGSDGAFISHAFAKDHHLRRGLTVTMETPRGDRPTFRIVGIFKPPPGGSPFGSLTISTRTFDKLYTQPENIYTFVTMTGGVTDANTKALEQTLAPYPNAKVADRNQFIDDQISFLSTILNVLYVLLGLSVIVS